jgi:DNA repair photolyase
MSDKTIIITRNGKEIEATCPVIVSASRSTDIPAFYAKWFINRLKEGYCVWYNPFNQQPMYISFKNTKVVVFWTKDPEPMIGYLSELDNRGIHYYFHVTLNDYEKEGFEPNVPPLQHRIDVFRHLSDKIGKEKIIWRFDPFLLSEQITPRQLLTKVYHVGNQLKGYTDKLVFSFIDVKAYRKVQNNLIKETPFFTKENIETAEPMGDKRIELIEGLVKLRNHWKSEEWELKLATCAESINLESYGIEHNCCIDGELMKQIFSNDEELVYYLNIGNLPERDMFGNFASRKLKDFKAMKDKGQRKECGCMISKDIGMYNTCRHFCVYCYANTSKEVVAKNARLHNDESESIIE